MADEVNVRTIGAVATAAYVVALLTVLFVASWVISVFGAWVIPLVVAVAVALVLRWTLPGPEAAPWWLHVGLGLAGAGAGTAIAYGLGLGWAVAVVAAAAGAAGVLAAYRSFVERRSLWGPGARRFAGRGVGVAKARSRLRLDETVDGRDLTLDAEQALVELDRLAALLDERVISAEEFAAGEAELGQRARAGGWAG